ncbi:MAG: sialidase family protein [Planctomycetota bacterium]
MAAIEPVPSATPPLWAQDVSQKKFKWPDADDSSAPQFMPPIPFVVPPAKGPHEPFYSHNHQPAITYCDNGDLLAIWFSTRNETGLEMTVLASRLRAGAQKWDPASQFFKASNRNMTGSALFHDGKGTLYHFNGMGPAGVRGWKKLALLMRTSTDNGVTWTTARPISTGATYKLRHQVIAGTFMTQRGALVQPCDATFRSSGTTAIHISWDKGVNWKDSGGDIQGIHAGVVDLKDGRLLAFGRSRPINGKMPVSVSDDMGKTWAHRASPFPPIGGGQRLVLTRLREGPLMFVSFGEGMTFAHKAGSELTGSGMFAALSFDEGESWPARKLLTPGKGEYDGGAWTKKFTASPTQAEPKGYLAVTQTPDKLIHLISSRLHYRFNLAELMKETNDSLKTEP